MLLNCVVTNEVPIIIGGGIRGAEGATRTAPPDLKIYAFAPPPDFMQEINLHQLGIVLTYLYLVSLVQPA